MIYRFGHFTVDSAERRLLREETAVPLPPKAFDLLLMLVENHGHALSKDELMQRIWPDAFVEEATLAQYVFKLRKMLDEGTEASSWIETVPKYGYRFSPEVEAIRSNGSSLPRTPDEAPPVPTPAVSVPAPSPSEPRPTPRWLLFAVLAIAAGALSGLLWRFLPRPAEPPSPAAQTMALSRLTNTGTAVLAAIAPDGKFVGFVIDHGERQSLWIQQVEAGSDAQLVAPTKDRYQGLTFSPDGNWVYFVRDFTLSKVPVLGGRIEKILDDVERSITFASDGTRFAFLRENLKLGESAIYIANADGGGEKKLTARKHPVQFRSISWSPDGATLSCSVGSETKPRSMSVVQIAADTGIESPLSLRTWYYIGQVAWVSDGTGVMAAAFEMPEGLAQIWFISYPSGEARRVTNDLAHYRGVSVALRSRELVTVQRTSLSTLWVASGGGSESARQITTGFGRDNHPSWTSDGRIVYDSETGGNRDIWIVDAGGSHRKRLTFEPAADLEPTLSPDDRYVVFVSTRSGAPNIWRMNVDGSDPRQLTSGPGEASPRCAPDGRWIVYEAGALGRTTLARVPIEGGKSEPLTDRHSRFPAVSPDGERIACYYWDEQPGSSTKIAVFPSTGGVSNASIEIPETFLRNATVLRWSKGGSDIAYVLAREAASNIWMQPLDGSPARQWTRFAANHIFSFDVSRDGRLVCARGPRVWDAVLISNF